MFDVRWFRRKAERNIRVNCLVCIVSEAGITSNFCLGAKVPWHRILGDWVLVSSVRSYCVCQPAMTQRPLLTSENASPAQKHVEGPKQARVGLGRGEALEIGHPEAEADLVQKKVLTTSMQPVSL